MRRSGTILFLGLRTYGIFGGLQAFNRRLILALASRSKALSAPPPVIVLRHDATADMPKAIRALFLPCGPSPLRLLWNALGASRGIETIIVGHVNLLPVAALCRIVSPRAKVLLMVHGDEVWGDPVYRARRWFDRPLMRRLNQIVSVSEFTARRMRRAFGLPEPLFRILRNAVDPLEFTPQFPVQPPEFLSVTRLAAHDHGKNIDKVLRALALVAARQLPFRYTVIGDGVLRADLQELAQELGIADRVFFAGRVDDAALASAYARSLAFVLPSAKEGFGIVYLEAWQRYLPVICGTQDAAHEIVSDGEDGFAVDPADIDLLANRMQWLITHPQMAQAMGAAGREKVQRSYLMRHFDRDINRILDEVWIAHT